MRGLEALFHLCLFWWSISVKARELSTWLLHEHEKDTTLIKANEADTLRKMVFSTTWSFWWLTRNNYNNKWLHGEAADVERAAVTDGIASLRQEISNYDSDNIYNIDETRLNLCLLPRQTYIHKSEWNVWGTKSMKVKDCITLYVTTNAIGLWRLLFQW